MEEHVKHLRRLITQNRLAAFFKYWKENVPSTSHLNDTADQLQATWRKLEDDDMIGILDSRDAGTRRAKLVNGMLRLTSKLSEETDDDSGSETPAAPNPLHDLIHRKLEALRRERILAVDAAVKFKLDEEIKELEKQLR